MNPDPSEAARDQAEHHFLSDTITLKDQAEILEVKKDLYTAIVAELAQQRLVLDRIEFKNFDREKKKIIVHCHEESGRGG